MDNLDIYLKAAIASLMAAVTVRFGTLGELLWLFIAAVALDYVTGVSAAAYHKQLHSGIGIKGIIKKVGECAVIAVAMLTDEVVAEAGTRLGLSVSTGGTITAIVIIWLILNELISILENIAKLGIDLPPFLLSAIQLLKKRTENKTDGSHADNAPADGSSAKKSSKKNKPKDEPPGNKENKS